MRKALKVVGIVTGALILLGAIATIIEDAGDDPPTRTDQPTVTAALTRAADPDDELTASERACADNWPTISYVEMRRMKADRSIDGIYDWSGGYWVSYAKIMDIC